MNFISPKIATGPHEEISLDTYSCPSSPQRKWPIRYRSIELVAVCADIITIALASTASVFLYQLCIGWIGAGFAQAVGSAVVVSAMFVSLLRVQGMYRPSELLVLRSQIRAVCGALLFAFVVLAAAAGLLNVGEEYPRGAGAAFALTSLASLAVGRALMKSLLMRGLSKRKFAGGNIILISDQPQSSDVGLVPTLNMLGYSVTKHFKLPPLRSGADPRKRLSALVIEKLAVRMLRRSSLRRTRIDGRNCVHSSPSYGFCRLPSPLYPSGRFRRCSGDLPGTSATPYA